MEQVCEKNDMKVFLEHWHKEYLNKILEESKGASLDETLITEIKDVEIFQKGRRMTEYRLKTEGRVVSIVGNPDVGWDLLLRSVEGKVHSDLVPLKQWIKNCNENDVDAVGQLMESEFDKLVVSIHAKEIQGEIGVDYDVVCLQSPVDEGVSVYDLATMQKQMELEEKYVAFNVEGESSMAHGFYKADIFEENGFSEQELRLFIKEILNNMDLENECNSYKTFSSKLNVYLGYVHN